MTAKLTASADGSKVLIGTAAEDALEIDATTKTVKALAPYTLVGNGPAFSASRTTIQLAVSGNDLIVIFPNELFDTNAAYNPTNGRFQPNVAGYYQVNALVNLNGDGIVSAASLNLIKNGATNMAASRSAALATVGTFESHAISQVVYMNGTTDYLEVWANLTSTMAVFVNATVALPATFSAFLARAA